MSKTGGAMMLCERQGEEGELNAAIEANLRELGLLNAALNRERLGLHDQRSIDHAQRRATPSFPRKRESSTYESAPWKSSLPFTF